MEESELIKKQENQPLSLIMRNTRMHWKIQMQPEHW